MAILDKLAFWKKKDDFGDLDAGGDLGKDPFGGPSPSGFGSPNDFSNPSAFNDSSFGAADQSGFPPQQPSNLQSQYPSRYPAPQQQFGQQQSPSFSQPQFNSPSYSSPQFNSPQYSNPGQGGSDYLNQKSMEVISSKIDALRAAIDSMNARLANIERIAGQEEENRRSTRRYY